MTTEKEVEKGISNIVGALTDPIIVFPGGWGDTLPDWLKNAITLERLVGNVKAIKGELPTGTDAEACAYLMTASLSQPLSSDWTQIYLYVSGKVCGAEGKEIPEDIRVETLNTDQERDLNRLKAWLYQRRTNARQDRDRAERREKREEEATAREAAQPVLFDF
ncbi:hypothetical protein ES707_13015 [subsurface metagenome]